MRRQRRAGEKKKIKQATDFEEAVSCPSAVVQGAAERKNEGERPGYLGPHHHVEAAVDWCRRELIAVGIGN